MNYGSPEPVGTASQHASVPVSSAPAAPAVQSSLSGVGLTGKDIEKWAAAITKAFLTSPAFQKAYAAEIKESHRAVDHGIDPETYGQSSTMDPAAMAAVPMVNMMRSAFSHEPLKAQFDQERQNLAQTIKEETGAERDKAQKYLAKLSAIASLATSNSDEFKKTVHARHVGQPRWSRHGSQTSGHQLRC